MSVPDHMLDPEDDPGCFQCMYEEFEACILGALEEIGASVEERQRIMSYLSIDYSEDWEKRGDYRRCDSHAGE